MSIFTGLLSMVILPIQLITTATLGFLDLFGFVGLIVELLWTICFYFPLLGITSLYEKVSFLRFLIGLVGLPFAILGYVYSCLTPSFGNFETRTKKFLLCESFPYTSICNGLIEGDSSTKFRDGFNNLLIIFNKAPSNNKLLRDYIRNIKLNNGII